MECAAKGRGSRCVGPPVRRCARCEAVAYCSLSHQISHWSDHKEECERLEQQMKCVGTLNDFPFTFSQEDALQICESQETRCSFLARRNLHLLGMWLSECCCGSSSFSSNYPRLIDCWNLSNSLCPCGDPVSPLSRQLSSWKDYYEWRCLPLDSPVALLLHWPLTIYRASQLISWKQSAESSNEINIHYLGPEKELFQLLVFAELLALFPHSKVHIVLVGPAVPQYRDGERINLLSYAHCDDGDCKCKMSNENFRLDASNCRSSVVTLWLLKGFYHDRFRDIVKDSYPHLIVAPNAGIAAYPSWRATIELIKGLNVPAVFSDLCEEAAHLAACCLSSVVGRALTLPIQLNPFRQPLVVEDSALYLPCYSNCFLFGRGIVVAELDMAMSMKGQGLGFGLNLGAGLKVPFRVRDVLPVLPRQISWPVLNNIHSAVDLLPSFVGSIAPNNGSTQWEGACFKSNNAWLELTDGDDKGLAGGVLYLTTSMAHSWTCMDLYVFATPYRVTWDYYFTAREHKLQIDSWEEPAELEYVKQHGVSVFLMPSGMLGTFLSLVDVLPLFSDSGWGQHSNIAFLEKHMGATFEKRPQPWQVMINPEDVHSGDFLAVSKIRGRWGGFETLEKWVTGAFAGHTAVCLKDELGNLWVGESGHENEKGEEIIVVIPWREWWELARKDNSNPHIALLPLHPDLRTKFNSTAAWEYARSMTGKPYGYHNMIFSWIDTIDDNYPPPLDAHLVVSVMSMWTRIQPAYAANMWNEALNKRLGTEGLDLHEILVETENRGIAFDQLLTIPEQDEWVYSDGKSTTCVAFILEMYKEAGIFNPLSSSIQVTEFTIRDAYMLKIFEDNATRLPNWCNTEDGLLPFCQILGEYRLELPHYNTIELYANMNENCPSLPPTYERPLQC
ncbi:hypothetical protein Nepgr_003505 [Nepenthes gracilis]|uniref:MYND-type domain-containing protein n=1 Tax=Nepenthes gracilis TaxID=150966 RepID=A0AAD3XE09_NEPGR|nr:hypothetical protein Nepgr_003505 [Nepenthes gracilis]